MAGYGAWGKYTPYKKPKGDAFTRPDVAPEAASAKWFEAQAVNAGGQEGKQVWKDAPKFDSAAAIANNPYLKEAIARAGAENIADDATRLRQAQQMFIGSGYEFDPTTFGKAQGFSDDQIARLKSDFSDPAFLELMRKNNAEGISTKAQIETGSKRALAGNYNRLAARGIASSGAATHAAVRNAEDRKLADYQAQATALNTYQDINSVYDQGVKDREAVLREEARRAADQAKQEGVDYALANPGEFVTEGGTGVHSADPAVRQQAQAAVQANNILAQNAGAAQNKKPKPVVNPYRNAARNGKYSFYSLGY